MRVVALYSVVGALTFAPFVQAAGLYGKDSSVLQVDGKTWDKLIFNAQHPSIVEFYAPWCGHCQNLKPAYEKAAKSLDGLAQVAAINCDDENNKAFCGRMNIKGFPTLKKVRTTLVPGKPIIEDYNGERTAKAIVETAKGLITNHGKIISDKDVNEWLEEGNATAKAILFSDKGTVGALFKVLSKEYLGNMHFAQIRNKNTAAVSMFGISKYPTLVVLPGGAAPPVVYEGEMSKPAMKTFLSQYAELATWGRPPKSTKKKESKGASASASSAFKKASASHASAEASEAAASAAAETLDEPIAATESPGPMVGESAEKPINLPDVAPPLPTLATQGDLQGKCLGHKTQTCILALLPPSADADAILSETAMKALATLAELSQKHKSRGGHLFPFFSVPANNEGGKELRTSLALSPDGMELIAVNGKRAWWRHFNAEQEFEASAIEGWVDGIRLGESKKERLPEALITARSGTAPAAEEPVEESVPAHNEL